MPDFHIWDDPISEGKNDKPWHEKAKAYDFLWKPKPWYKRLWCKLRYKHKWNGRIAMAGVGPGKDDFYSYQRCGRCNTKLNEIKRGMFADAARAEALTKEAS